MSKSEGSSPKALTYVHCTVQKEDSLLGPSWKGLRPLPACGEDMIILQLDEAET